MLANMVTPGYGLVDVGCDHGYLSIYLVREGVCPGAIAMDVRKGPLSGAKEHIREFGLGDYIEVRLSDGLEAYVDGEAKSLVCAGMGGRLMEKILTDSMDKAKGLQELILQPQSELREFRAFLREAGFRVICEDAVCEEGKYYFAMKAVPVVAGKGSDARNAEAAHGRKIYDMYGELLLKKRHPVLQEFLIQRLKHLEQLETNLSTQTSEKAGRRKADLEREVAEVREALLFYREDKGDFKKGRMDMVTVTIHGKQKEVQQGTTLEKLAAEYQQEYDSMIAAAAVNGKIIELFKKVVKDCTVDFFTLRDDVGHKTYMRAATMLFLKSVYDLFGAEAAQRCYVEFSIGRGIYISTYEQIPSTMEHAIEIKGRMWELVEKKVLFKKRTYRLEDAMDLFRSKGMADKAKLFRYRRSSTVNIYEMEGYYDYYYGYMLPDAGYVKWFDVIPYEKGFMLLLPSKENPLEVEAFTERKKLFETMVNASHWGSVAGIETVGDLNEQICGGSMSDLILVQEAEQERKIGEIAKEISDRGNVKFVMIAGPSSSGKTSFSHRLSIQLRTLGKTPHPIALDNYFVDRELTPKDEKGDYNFECLGAIDVKLFNDDMMKLLAGERVELPSFNFKIGKREYKGDYMQLGESDILVIEGIHGLNEKMSYALPEESKFKIYISALTTLNVDRHNRISTTDGRLLRRLVRDARTRGSSAQRTIQMWSSVRRGEEENIFPFQEGADAMFNSALIYELAVLKPFAEPLLFQIPKDAPEYYEAKRLLKFLDYFLSVPSESLPNNSLCREFVGGSCFNV